VHAGRIWQAVAISFWQAWHCILPWQQPDRQRARVEWAQFGILHSTSVSLHSSTAD
jgi:hypothetical protein